MGKTGALILAAGESSRLGQPKQLIQFRGKVWCAEWSMQLESAMLADCGRHRSDRERSRRELKAEGAIIVKMRIGDSESAHQFAPACKG